MRIVDQRIKRKGRQTSYTTDYIGNLYPAIKNEDGLVRMNPIKIEFNPENDMEELQIQWMIILNTLD